MNWRWVIAGMCAVLLHAVLLFGFRLESAAVPLPISDTAVDVSLEGAEPGSAAAAAAPAAPESPPTPPPPVEQPPPPVTPPPPEPAPTPETPPPVTTTVEPPPPAMPPTPALAQRPAHHLPPRPAHPSQSMARAVGSAVGTAPEGHAGSAAAGAAGSGASPIRARSNPKPPYPPEAERLHQQGRVMLEVQVGTDGRATSVSVKRSSGFPLLDSAAVQAVQRWTFDPARIGGLPVAGKADVPVNFALGQ